MSTSRRRAVVEEFGTLSRDRERHERAMGLFQRAAALPPAERPSYLDAACAGDPEMARYVADLLAADDSTFDLGRVRLPTDLETADDGRPAPAAIPAGARIGSYSVVSELGRGGWGTVYLAERADRTYHQKVAIKVVHGGWLGGDRLRRFQAERQILAALTHPNIARLMDAGETADHLPYLVMEYVDGRPVDEFCDRERLSVRRRLELFLQICAAVQYAHQRLVVHRDLKPANVVVTGEGEPKLLDFGIAKILDPTSFPIDVERTAEAHRLLTPDYASPEQIRGAPITTATDVYSLGVVLYLLLAGRLPFALGGESLLEIERTVCETPPPRPSQATTGPATSDAGLAEVAERRATTPVALARQLRGDLDNIVLKALAKEPEQRYRSVEQMAGDVENLLAGRPVTARPSTLVYRTRKLIARHRLGFAAVLAIVIAVALGFWAQRREAARANREAVAARQVSDFLVEVFEEANPSQASGDDVTVRQLLDRSVDRIDRELVDQPLTRARLMSTMGKAYEALGAYPTAERLVVEALELRREILGPDDPEVASSLVQVGDLYRHQSRFDEAVASLERALELRRRSFAADSLEVAEAENDLGLALLANGDHQRARALLTAALAARRKGGDLRHEAQTLSNLALLENGDGEYAAAERYGRQALAIRRRILPPDHLMIAFTLQSTAQAVEAQGEGEEAERLLREALSIEEKALGDDHPAVAITYNNLANVLQDGGDLDAAEVAYRKALGILRHNFGDEHREVAVTLNNLAWLHRDRGDLAGAEPLFRRSLELRRKLFGDDHPDTARALHNLASLLAQEGDLAAAEPLYRQALDVRRRVLRPGHPDTGGTELGLGELRLARGDADEAARLAEEAVGILKEALGPDDPKTAQAEELLRASREARLAGPAAPPDPTSR